MDLDKLFELWEIRNADEQDMPIPEYVNPFEMDDEEPINPYKREYNSFLNLVSKKSSNGVSISGENMDAIGKYNLSLEEASIIYMYTKGSLYVDVNQQLRQNEVVSDDVIEYTMLLNQALIKMPSYNQQELYRCICYLSMEELSQLYKSYKSNLNKVVEAKQFMSCHTDSIRLCDFQLIISTSQNSRAKNLNELTFDVNEKEVLFMSNTEFIVKEVDETTSTIYLEEC